MNRWLDTQNANIDFLCSWIEEQNALMAVYPGYNFPSDLDFEGTWIPEA